MKILILLSLLFALSIYRAHAEGNLATKDGNEDHSPTLAISHYRPMYFLLGKPHTKIEISLKAQVISTLPFYFGYTQLMMWDLFLASPFFYDLNYNPVFFYRFTFNNDNSKWLDFILDHESNGRGGTAERSWNRAAVLYHFLLFPQLKETGHINGSIKAWLPFRIDSTNSDILRYRGVWEINFALTNLLSDNSEFDEISFRLYPGGRYFTDPTRGGQELSYRTELKYFHLLPLLVLQVFHGYGESLQLYADNHWAARIGFSF